MQSVISFSNSFKSQHNGALRVSLLESQYVDLLACADFLFVCCFLFFFFFFGKFQGFNDIPRIKDYKRGNPFIPAIYFTKELEFP